MKFKTQVDCVATSLANFYHQCTCVQCSEICIGFIVLRKGRISSPLFLLIIDKAKWFYSALYPKIEETLKSYMNEDLKKLM